MTLPPLAAAEVAAAVSTKAADAADSGNSISSTGSRSDIFRPGGAADDTTPYYPSVAATTSSSSRLSKVPSYATPSSAGGMSLYTYSSTIPGDYSPAHVPMGESPMKSAPSVLAEGTTTTATSSTVPSSPPAVKSTMGINRGDQSPFGAQERLSSEAEELLAREMLASSSATARSAARRKERLERKEKRNALTSKRIVTTAYTESTESLGGASKRLSRRERRWPEEEVDTSRRQPTVRGSGSIEPRDRRRDEEYIQPPPVSSIGVDPIKVEKATESKRKKKVPTTPTESRKAKDADLDRWYDDETLVRINILTSQPSGVREPTEFFIPASLVVQREKEMRASARKFGIDMNRWSGSLLVRKLKELQIQEEIQNLERKLDTLGVPNLNLSVGEESPHNVMDPPDVDMFRRSREMNSLASASFDDRRMSPPGGKPYIFFLDPEAECSSITNQTNSLTWTPALTSCIRSYYNTGTIRVSDECLGNDVLVALEYFGIVYAPDQLAFDTFGCYLRVKLWSDYYTHRTAMADWVIRRLMGTHSRHSHAFVTSPEPLEGQHYLGSKKLELMDGGLALDSSKLGDGNEGHPPPSCSVVHEFFNNDDEDNVPSSASVSIASPSDSIDAVLRRDFRGYLQNSLPGTTVTFGLREVTIAPGMNATATMSSTALVVTRAVLHVDFNTNPIRKSKKSGTAPDLGGTTFIVKTETDEGGTVISALEDEVEVESYIEKQVRKILEGEKVVGPRGSDKERLEEREEKEETNKELDGEGLNEEQEEPKPEESREEVKLRMQPPKEAPAEGAEVSTPAEDKEVTDPNADDEESKAESTQRLLPLHPLDTVQEDELLQDPACEEKEDETYDVDTSIEPDLPLKHVKVSRTGDQKSVYSALSGPFRDGEKEVGDVETPDKHATHKEVDVSALTDAATPAKDVRSGEALAAETLVSTHGPATEEKEKVDVVDASSPSTVPTTPSPVQAHFERAHNPPTSVGGHIDAEKSKPSAPEVNKWMVSPEQSPLEAVGLTEVFSLKGLGSFDLSTSGSKTAAMGSLEQAKEVMPKESEEAGVVAVKPADTSTAGEGTIESMTNKISKMIFGGTDKYVGRTDKYDVDAVNPETDPTPEAPMQTEFQQPAADVAAPIAPTAPVVGSRPMSPPPDYMRPQSPGVLSFRSDVTGGTRPRDLPRSLGADRTQLLEVKSMVSNTPTELRQESVDDANAAWLRNFLCPTNCFAESPCFASGNTIDEAAVEAATRKGAEEQGDVATAQANASNGRRTSFREAASGKKSPLTLPKMHTREVLGKEYGVEVRPSKSFGGRSVGTDGDRKTPPIKNSSSRSLDVKAEAETGGPSRKSPLTVMPTDSEQQKPIPSILKPQSTALPEEAVHRQHIPPILRSHSTALPLPEDHRGPVVSRRSFSPTMGAPGSDPGAGLEVDKKTGRRLQNLLGFKKRFGRM